MSPKIALRATASSVWLLALVPSVWGQAPPSATDRDFIEAIAQGCIAEIDAARLATQRASKDAVRRFAEHVLDEHSRANARLKSLAADRKMILPTVPNSERITERKRLEAQDATRFDAEYVSKQVKEHERTVQLLKEEIANGQDPDLLEFAKDTLSAVTRHLEVAKRLQNDLDSTAERKS